MDEWLLVNAHTDVDDVPVDTLVVPSTVVGKQCVPLRCVQPKNRHVIDDKTTPCIPTRVLASVATAAAVDDALFLLTNALQEEVIGLPDFVQVRLLCSPPAFSLHHTSRPLPPGDTEAGSKTV